jgi:hypothetical protein
MENKPVFESFDQFVQFVYEAALNEGLRESINAEMNEISSDLFKRSQEISKQRGTDLRTNNMGPTFFSQFIGKPLFDGTIVDITTHKPQQSSSYKLSISIKSIMDGQTYVHNIYYNIDSDVYFLGDNYEGNGINRKDAWMLSKIAMKINPDTKYKNPGSNFDINGY